MALLDYSRMHLKENRLGTNTFDNRNPSMWTSFPPLSGNQTLSQYISPDSIYSTQHTSHLNSHLVSQSLLSTAMQCIFHFPLQMVQYCTVQCTHTVSMVICTDACSGPICWSLYIYPYVHFLNHLFSRGFQGSWSQSQLSQVRGEVHNGQVASQSQG